jgi:protein-S-isoprenylcysteine O-methyltransferase Ste14
VNRGEGTEGGGRGHSRLVGFVHTLAVTPTGRRRWTLAGLTVFASSLAVVVLAGLATDRLASLPPLPGGAAWTAAGIGLVLSGLGMCAWCVGLFARARGTPVPLNPPTELIQRGPYGWARNPMLTGVFAALFGVGLLLRSPSILLLWAPAYVLLHVLELKWVEEPELERRFGVAYRAYRDGVPMFVPRFWRWP